eukprot:215146-Pyramimonas_sp.AAC.1
MTTATTWLRPQLAAPKLSTPRQGGLVRARPAEASARSGRAPPTKRKKEATQMNERRMFTCSPKVAARP